MITDKKEYIKAWWEEYGDAVFWGCFVLLSILLLGGLTRLVFVWEAKIPITRIEGENAIMAEGKELYGQYVQASGLPGLVAASRNGKRYYYPWCAGLNRIKESNKIWFSSEEEAETAGYTIASGCDGL